MSTSRINRAPRVESRPAPTLRYGDRIGDYIINGFAGVGATSYVYCARHEQSFEPVAIKVLHPHLLEDEIKRTRFLREAHVMMNLRHANVVRFHEILQIEGHLAFVMEFIEGKTLEEWLEEQGAEVDETTLACLFVDILRGLNHAHRAGIVHRDLKPANILITHRDGRYVAKIIDFGVARLSEQPTAPEDKKKIVGTAAYISPEEVRDPDTVCAASDLYSIGVMMYEAACGTRPFHGRGIRDLMQAHVHENPPSPREINPRLTPAFAEVIMRAMAKTPQARFTSAPEVIHALETAIREAMMAAMVEHAAEDEQAATVEWAREAESEGRVDPKIFVAWFRQYVVMALTLFIASGARADGADPHHLNRYHDIHLPLQ